MAVAAYAEISNLDRVRQRAVRQRIDVNLIPRRRQLHHDERQQGHVQAPLHVFYVEPRHQPFVLRERGPVPTRTCRHLHCRPRDRPYPTGDLRRPVGPYLRPIDPRVVLYRHPAAVDEHRLGAVGQQQRRQEVHPQLRVPRLVG